MTTAAVPPSVGDYELLAKLGEGGMGVVHLARRPGGDRVALKVLRPHVVGDDETRARLAREVSSLERIRSRWVAEILDADPWAPIPYIATRYVPGLSLHDHVLEEGPIEGDDLLWFAGCLAEGVGSVHAAGVLHRDVKPSNVLMEGRTPILIDFGLARVADDPRLTHTGFLLGTPGYLAPEILYGDDATAASDVHSWAATVAYAGLARPPFGRGPAMAIMDRVRRGEHDLRGLPDELARLLAAALDPEPERRPTLAQLLAWLGPRTTRRDLPATPLAQAVPQTVPLAAVHRAALADGTEVLGPDLTDPAGDPVGAADPTRMYTVRATAPLSAAPPLHRSVPPAPPAPAAPYAPLQPPASGPAPGVPGGPGGPEASEEPQPWPWEWEDAPAEPRAPLAERTRRLVVWVLLAALVGAAVAVAPWVATGSVLLLTWLLRTGSLAASGLADRRRLRGARWHDVPGTTLGLPWQLLRSLPSTVLLALWALGVAAVGGLVCFAAAVDQRLALGVCGTLLAVGAWAGPGGSRVRGPLGAVVRPAARRPVGWLIVCALLLAGAAGGAAIARGGADWTPGSERPLSGRDLPGLGAVAR
ncbi:serine/threonine protein kinase [Nocardioides sp. TRM66260-LWL]|uniref:serine/threonine-protein kinase n=1 Tax=Nocardioides sp. TRM66260-LWL TaxID=2874478 RepID=UPI001CC5A8BE|nr:protein kinase [Nocardioides sp. TRM66260-LWL]MBZ5733103.1 serine/threonine protein kinase [Nocardioides sp. TRM66260-LWL]